MPNLKAPLTPTLGRIVLVQVLITSLLLVWSNRYTVYSKRKVQMKAVVNISSITLSTLNNSANLLALMIPISTISKFSVTSANL